MLTIKNILAFHVSVLQEWIEFIELLAEKINHLDDIVRIERMGFPEGWKSETNDPEEILIDSLFAY